MHGRSAVPALQSRPANDGRASRLSAHGRGSIRRRYRLRPARDAVWRGSRELKGRYSPADCIGTRKERITGNPDCEMVSTSHVERSNLSMRMHMRRFTRLTNAHSKKFENHCHMVALYTVWYNYARDQQPVKMSPAMAANISDRLWDMADIVALIDASEVEPKTRGPYRPR